MNLKTHDYQNTIYGLNTLSNINELTRKFSSHQDTLYNITLNHGFISESYERSVIKQRRNNDGSTIIWKDVNIDKYGNIEQTDSCTIEYTSKNGEKWRFIGIDIEDGGFISKQAKSITIEHCKPNQSFYKQKVANIFVYDNQIPEYISPAYDIVHFEFAQSLMQFVVIQPNLTSDQTINIEFSDLCLKLT